MSQGTDSRLNEWHFLYFFRDMRCPLRGPLANHFAAQQGPVSRAELPSEFFQWKRRVYIRCDFGQNSFQKPIPTTQMEVGQEQMRHLDVKSSFLWLDGQANYFQRGSTRREGDLITVFHYKKLNKVVLVTTATGVRKAITRSVTINQSLRKARDNIAIVILIEGSVLYRYSIRRSSVSQALALASASNPISRCGACRPKLDIRS